MSRSRRIAFAAGWIILCFAANVALAQSPAPDPALLARMLAMTQADRTQIMNVLTEAQARGAMLAEELARAQAKIKELEPKPAASAPPVDPPSDK